MLDSWQEVILKYSLKEHIPSVDRRGFSVAAKNQRFCMQ
jgi:hypothetical protein